MWRRGDATRPGRPSSPRTRGRALLLDLSGCLRPAPGCPHGSAQPWHTQSWELPAWPSSPRPSPPAALGPGTGTVSPSAAVAVLGNLCPTDTAPARAHAGHLGSPSAAVKARRVPGLPGCHSAGPEAQQSPQTCLTTAPATPKSSSLQVGDRQVPAVARAAPWPLCCPLAPVPRGQPRLALSASLQVNSQGQAAREGLRKH